jgi:hypothetical protein
LGDGETRTAPASGPSIVVSGKPGPVTELSSMTDGPREERRRYPRADVSWPVVVEVDSHVFRIESLNVSARGAKLRPKEPLQVGSLALLYFHPPDGPPLNLSAMVWRADPDGLVFFFLDTTLALDDILGG